MGLFDKIKGLFNKDEEFVAQWEAEAKEKENLVNEVYALIMDLKDIHSGVLINCGVYNIEGKSDLWILEDKSIQQLNDLKKRLEPYTNSRSSVQKDYKPSGRGCHNLQNGKKGTEIER